MRLTVELSGSGGRRASRWHYNRFYEPRRQLPQRRPRVLYGEELGCTTPVSDSQDGADWFKT